MDYSLYFQVYQKFSKMEDDYEIYKEMLEKHRLIKNQNVHEKKPEESISEDDDLAEGQASLEAAKDTKMKTDLQACVPTASPASSPLCPDPGSACLCSEQDQTPKLQLGDQVPGSVTTLGAVSKHVHSGGQDVVNNFQQKENEIKAIQMTDKFEDTAFAKYLLLEKTKAAKRSAELLTVEDETKAKAWAYYWKPRS